ncbi:Serine/threonine-protein kinase Sgk2 [Coemansia sp. RSA 1843]|nr:Serine/threonine-protein kinase Sgk2 [Coemansia sp. RSA 1843]
MDTTPNTSSSSGIPTALRHLLHKGAKNHHHAPQIDGIVHQAQKPTDSALAPPMHENPYLSATQKSLPAPSMYYTQRTLVASDPTIHASARSSLDMNVRTFVSNSDAAAAAAATASQQSVRTAAVTNSSANTSSNSGGIGAWLSRYSLRPTSNTGSRASANSTASSATSVSTINTITSSEYARHSIDNTLANMQLTTSQQHYYQPQSQPQQQQRQQALSAAITNIELCEASSAASSSSTAKLRKSSSRNKRHVVYRILVSGRDGQWWAMRRYSEFHDLYSILKKKVPQHTFSCTTGATGGTSARWSDLFPTKRWGLPPSIEVAAQWTDRLNVFLRAITTDTEICQCEEVQRFLCETTSALNTPATLSVIDLSVPGGGGGSAGTSTASIMSPASALRIQLPTDNGALAVATPGSIQAESDPRLAHDSIGRVSMPALKDNNSQASVTETAAFNVSQVMTPPTSGPKSIPDEHEALQASNPAVSVPAQNDQSGSVAPMVPPRPAKHQTMEYAKSPFGTVLLDDEASMQVLRKASDSILYLSAEKRPNMEPLTMRKKYGLRGNLQYINHAYSGDQGPDPRGSSMVIDEESEDIMMAASDNSNNGNNNNNNIMASIASPPSVSKSNTWNIQHTQQQQQQQQQNGSRSSEDIVMSHEPVIRSPTPPPRPALHFTQQGARPQVASLATRGNIQKAQLFHKSNVQVAGTPAMSSKGVNTLMSALVPDTQHSAPPGVQQFHNDSGENGSMAFTKQSVGLDDFHLLSIIGKGSYGQVMLARYKDTGKVMAIKVISKSKLRGRPNEIRRVMSERKVLERTVEHPFLVGLQCAFQTKDKLFFCLDYVNGGELFFHLQRERRFSENRARFYAAEITCALEYLHSMGVVYRDLKPENCLLDADGHVKIVDFGLAKEVGPVVWRTEGSALYSVEEGGKTGTFCGTPEYLAPEVLLRQRYGKEVDWYCLGAVLYEMLTGLPPFYDQDNNTMYRRILHEPLRFPSALPPPLRGNGAYNESCITSGGSNTVGKLAQDFITRILDRDPKNRLGNGVFGTENVKRHVFFHGIDWAKIYRQEYAPPFVPKVSSIFDLSNIDPEFRNEPIPESILAEGQVDIIAEAAEAERQADLALQAQLMAFPSPLNTPMAMSGAYFQQNRMVGVSSPPQSISSGARSPFAAGSSNGDAFQGFSFMSPNVGSTDENQ